MDNRADPELERRATAGAIAGEVIFHARRSDKAADQLFGDLGSEFRCRRSFEVPDKSPKHFIWLQFGENVIWNRELPSTHSLLRRE
jgi:hypothetical protein